MDGSMHAERGSSEVDGLRIAYWAAGSGQPLLLLHGIGSNGESFAPQLAGLADGFRVIAWDAPGYGGSADHALAKPRPRDYAAVAAGFIAALGLARAHVLGQSLGALMAGALARHHPERVDRLILASPAGGYRLGADAPYPPALQTRLDDMAQLGPTGMADRRAKLIAGPNADSATVAAVHRVLAQTRPGGYRQAVELLKQGDLAADAPRIAAPTLVACGDLDTVTPPERSRAIAAAIAGARYESLGAVGHGCYIQDPAGFNATVSAFLMPAS